MSKHGLKASDDREKNEKLHLMLAEKDFLEGLIDELNE